MPILLVWTTTPWTLPSNVAVAVGEAYDYVAVEENNGHHLILAKECLPSLYSEMNSRRSSRPIRVRISKIGSMNPSLIVANTREKSHYVVPGDFVTTTEGSGLVHIAPAFGQDDYDIGQKYNLPLVQLVGADGRFVAAVKEPWAGEYVKDADPQIIENLDGRGLLFKAAEYTHQYPFCWRCDNPLLYYAARIVVHPNNGYP